MRKKRTTGLNRITRARLRDFVWKSPKFSIYQGKSSEALPLQQQSLSVDSSTELEIRRKIFLSIALARLGHLDQAEQIILEAQSQCPDGPLLAEVLGARGVIDITAGKLDDAERVLQASLENSRRSGKQFLQTQALLNLSAVALREDHYEDALARFTAASVLARSIGSKLELEEISRKHWVGLLQDRRFSAIARKLQGG